MRCKLFKYKILISVENKQDVNAIIHIASMHHIKVKEINTNNEFIVEIYFSDYRDAYLFIRDIINYDIIVME